MYALPALTFDAFTRTTANAAALDAARGVADDRPDAPALLLLHGPRGTGKTRLLSAIGAARRRAAGDAGAIVEYVALGELTTRRAAGDESEQRYALADLLLVDDAHRAAGDASARAALAALLEAGKPGRRVVVALDCVPLEVTAGEPRITRLFAAATACDIGPHRAGAIAAPRAAFSDADERIGGRALPGAADAPRNDYASFLSDVVAAVAQHLEPWKQRLAEASSRWGGLGYAVGVLERALARATAPDVDGLLATYAAAVEHLRRLEAQAAAIDPELGGSPAFRDPERVGDAEAAFSRLLPAGPDAHHTLASYIGTGSNAAALQAAERAVEAPATDHNPLYVHGPSGSGRTHLLGATANALRVWRAGRVAYVAAPQFAEELGAAMRANTVERWRARYGRVDVLAVDDVHQLTGNARAEQELALLCATLRERGRQVLLAGERDASPASGMGEGLRMQIGRGHAAALDAPDRDLRARLIAAYFGAARRDVDADVVSYLAERVEPSTHRIAPTAERLLAAADRAGVPLTLPIARSELGRTPARTPLWAVSAGAGRSDPFFLDGEKVIWDWPDVGGRVIEELR